MGKPRLKITFAQDTNVFYAGSTVEGNVEVHVEEEIQVKAITLLCKGKATVWVQRQDYVSTNNESYATPPVLLREGSRGDSNVKLPPGVYTFPFEVKIPSEWPSSIDFVPLQFEVAYHFTCKLERSSGLFNTVEKTKQNFVVIHDFDCKSRPQWELGVRGDGQKYLCCLCCRSGPIIANLTLERQSFLPGETIKYDAKIWNNADKKVKVHVNFKMVMMKYTSGTPGIKTIYIQRIGRQPVYPSDDDQWTGELIVPPLPPSFLEGCGIIDRKYFVELVVLPSGFLPRCLSVPIEVFIGSLPRRPAGESVTPGNSSILVIGAAEYFMAQDIATEDRPISSIDVFVVGTERVLTKCPMIFQLTSGANITNIRWKSSVTPIG